MPKILRRAGYVFAALVLVIVLGFLGLNIYIGTGSAKQFAATQIASKFGVNVAITYLNSGMRSTAVRFELLGADADTLIISGSVRLDTSVYGLAVGNSPNKVHVEDAVLTLHFDKNGDLVTKLPQIQSTTQGGAIPEIEISGATVHIVQDGKPDFRASGINITLTDSGTKLDITGTIEDPMYGAWRVSGDWGTDGKAGTVRLATVGPIPLTPDKLKAIPFVPKETWETVELNGTSPVQVQVGRGADAKWSWHVELDPTDTHLKVFPIGLDVTKTSGKVVVDGAKVTLTGVRGTTADGVINTDALLDFGPTPSRLEFRVNVTGLDVKKTPASWGLAPRVDEGRLNGRGDITLLIQDGKVQPRGTGRAVISGKLFGGKAEVELLLQGDGQRLQFVDSPATTSRLPVEELYQAMMVLLLQPPATAPPKKDLEPQYVRANLKLTDVDIAELIQRGKIVAPVKLAGKVTLQIAAEIPTNNPGSLKFYRATGKVSTPSLQIEGLTLNQVTADVELRDGVLTLTRFSAAFPPGTDNKPGGFLGTARFGIDPRTELTADLKLDRIPLGQVFSALPGFAGKADGEISGTFELKTPGDKLGDLKTFVANGKLSSSGLTLFGQKANRLTVELALRNGVAQLMKAEADIYEGTVTGEVRLPLVGTDAGQFRIGFKDVDSAALTRAIPDSPVKLAGKFGGTLDGALPPLPNFEAAKVTGNLALDAPRLVVQGIPTTKLVGKLGYKPGAITYALKGDALGGSFDVDGTYPLTAKPAQKQDVENPAGGTVRFVRLRLDRLSRTLGLNTLESLRGEINVTLRFTHGADGPSGTGRLEIRDFGWGDDFFDTSDIVAEIRLTPQGIEIPALSGELAGGTLRGRVVYDFDEPRRSVMTLTLENADAETVLAPLGIGSASGRLSATVRSTIGREFRGGGTVTAIRAKLGGVDVSELRVPLRWAFLPGRRAQLTVRDATGTVASGRVTGRTELNWDGRTRVEGRIEFVDVNVGALAGTFGSSGYGIGKTTGRFDFTGGDVSSVNDVNGTLTAKFGQTTIRELPIVGTISPFLSPVQSLTRFDTGDVVARLGSGQFRIEQLALASSAAKLFAEGTVGLNGPLDLDVIYNTGQIGPNAPLLRLVARNIPAIGPIPVGLIVRVSEVLSNRVVRLRVAGTTTQPVVRVNAVGLLSENAVRFFIGQYVPFQSAAQ